MKKILFLFAFVSSAFAEPRSLSNIDARQLFVALSSIQSGTTATNAGLIADDINALMPKVKACDAALAVYQKKMIALGQSPDQAKAQDVMADYNSFMDRTVTVDLEPVVITNAEYADSKMDPKTWAIIKRLLAPPPDPKKK